MQAISKFVSHSSLASWHKDGIFKFVHCGGLISRKSYLDAKRTAVHSFVSQSVKLSDCNRLLPPSATRSPALNFSSKHKRLSCALLLHLKQTLQRGWNPPKLVSTLTSHATLRKPSALAVDEYMHVTNLPPSTDIVRHLSTVERFMAKFAPLENPPHSKLVAVASAAPEYKAWMHQQVLPLHLHPCFRMRKRRTGSGIPLHQMYQQFRSEWWIENTVRVYVCTCVCVSVCVCVCVCVCNVWHIGQLTSGAVFYRQQQLDVQSKRLEETIRKT
jgi:hypothetical protein